MGKHADARAAATAALTKRFGVTPTAGEVWALTGIGDLESNYGAGWPGTNYIGAITADSSWKGETFDHKDSYPDENGNPVWYVTKFKKYPTAVDGWADLANEAFANRGRANARAAAKLNDWAGVSRVLRETTYYKGFGKTKEEQIANHVKALTASIKRANKELGIMDQVTTTTSQAPSIQIRVQNPQGDRIGVTSVSELDAPGLTVLSGIYGAPVCIAYPNGWRMLKFSPEVTIPARSNLPYTPVEQTEPLTFGTMSGIGIGVLGIVVTLMAASAQRRTAHA